MSTSPYEAMRLDPANWILGFIYRCPYDPRLVVRNRHFIGWTWNFGNRWVVPGIVGAIALFLGPLYLAWWLGVRAPWALAGIWVASLVVLGLVGVRLARDPAA